jgi:hypothetical protein
VEVRARVFFAVQISHLLKEISGRISFQYSIRFEIQAKLAHRKNAPAASVDACTRTFWHVLACLSLFLFGNEDAVSAFIRSALARKKAFESTTV